MSKERTEEQKAQDRERAKKYRERKKAEAEQENQTGAAAPTEFEGRPSVEDAEAAYNDGDPDGERIAAAIMRRYNKSQTWAFILYEDSAPKDYEDKLRMLGVQFALSPWHDKDTDGKDEHGKPKYKKKHRHGMLHWPGGATTYKTAAAITRDVLHATIPVPLVSPRGYYRYFTHLDNPKKAKYDEADIITGNGFDIGEFLQLTAKEKNDLAKLIITEIINQGMTEYWELVMYAMLNMDAAAFEFVRTNTLFLRSALQSKRFMEQTPGMDARFRMGKPYPDPLGNMTDDSGQARPDQRDQKQQIAQNEED